MEIEEIIAIAENIAALIGLRLKNPQLIRSNMKAGIPVTTIISNTGYMLWIDRHYIAVGTGNPPDVLYIYISKYHISEELLGVTKLLKSVKSFPDCFSYSNIAEQLRTAKEAITFSDSSFYLLDNYEEQIQRSC